MTHTVTLKSFHFFILCGHSPPPPPPPPPLQICTKISIYPFLDTAYAFICLQAVETLTTIARDATDVLSSATGREIALAFGQALETDIAEAVSPPDTHTSRVREEIHNLDQNSEVFEEEVDNIAQIHSQNDLFEFEGT